MLVVVVVERRARVILSKRVNKRSSKTTRGSKACSGNLRLVSCWVERVGSMA